MNDKKNETKSTKTNGNPEQAEQAGEAQVKQAKSGARKLGGTRAEERIAALDTEGASLSAQVEELTSKLARELEAVVDLETGQHPIAKVYRRE